MSSPCAITQASAIWPGVRALLGGERLDFLQQCQVALEVLALEARRVAAVVGGIEAAAAT